jgi:hypothetical protein
LGSLGQRSRSLLNINRILPLPQGNSLIKIQYTELKLSCGNDPVVKNTIYSNGDLDLRPNDLYWIFTKLDHMIPLWKGKNPIYFGVIRSKVKDTVTINRIFDNRVISAQ